MKYILKFLARFGFIWGATFVIYGIVMAGKWLYAHVGEWVFPLALTVIVASIWTYGSEHWS